MARVIVTADDYGLTRGITDSILEAADKGALTRVSVLANGYDLEYALAQWRSRQETLSLSFHLNLTEGVALSSPKDIPHLADAQGRFRHSPASLLVRSWWALPSTRQAIAQEVEQEFMLQLSRIRSHVGQAAHIGVDSHQHVHMVPLVFGVVARLAARESLAPVRFPREPFFVPRGLAFLDVVRGIARQCGLRVFVWANMPAARAQGVAHPGYFVGALASGRLSLAHVRTALKNIPQNNTAPEVGTHPGIAKDGELAQWGGDVAWHYSPWRCKEQELLMGQEMRKLLQSFGPGPLSAGLQGSTVGKFLIAGVAATATNLALLYGLTELFAIWYLVSAVIAYALATLVGFILQKFWAFAHYSRARIKREAAWFVLNNLFGLVFASAALFILVEYGGWWYMLAQAAALVVVAAWNFVAYRFFIFPKEA